MTDFGHHYKIQKNAGFRLGHSLNPAFFCDLWILLFVQPIVSNRHIDLSDLSYTAPMWQILNFHCTGARLKNSFQQSARPTLRYVSPEFGCRSPLRRPHPDKISHKLWRTSCRKLFWTCSGTSLHI